MSKMDEKRAFIEHVLSRKDTMVDCCRLANISRETGYKWWRRYKREGEAGLVEHSRARKSQPHSMSSSMASWLCEIRRSHPKWGPRTIVGRLKLKHPGKDFPSPTAVGDLFKREGLVRNKKRRARSGDYSSELGGYYGPNAVWGADFKGQFRCKNGKLCYPLTISDGFSRSLLCCRALRSTHGSDSKRVFESVFREYGLPDAIRTDNGVPFSSVAGVSPLSIWWIKLGITPLRIKPGKPTENGRHERIHRTLKAEVPPAKNMRQQQRDFDAFINDYNLDRPHQSLNGRPPSESYTPSTKCYPRKLCSPKYDENAYVETVTKNGRLFFNGKHHQITPLLAQEPVGIVLDKEGRHTVLYGPLLLGTIDKRGVFKKGKPKQTVNNPRKSNKNTNVSGMCLG